MNEFLRKILFLPDQGSTIAPEIDLLHYLVITVTMVGSAAVGLVALYFTIRYRHTRRPEGCSAMFFQMPWRLELVLVGGLSALFIAFWWIGIRQYLRLREVPRNALEVYVVAKQWMWKFDHLRGGSSIARLRVPAGVPVKLIMTSRDVIHSFYVPEFRVKQDILPGRYTTVWFEAPHPGVYEILCTEFCGTGHSTMRGVVEVLTVGEFGDWGEGVRESTIAPQTYDEPFIVYESTPSEQLDLATMGERTAAQHGCLRCHTLDGSRHIAPSFGGLYGSRIRLENGTERVADEAYITQSMMDPLSELHVGFEPVMPSYQGLIQPTDVAAIIELIKTLRDVEGDADQPRGSEEAPGRPPLYPGHPHPPPDAERPPTYDGPERGSP